MTYLTLSSDSSAIRVYVAQAGFWQKASAKGQRSASSVKLSFQYGPWRGSSPVPLFSVPIMPSNWIMPLSGIISSCGGIQTFVFIKDCSQEWLNDWPSLINMNKPNTEPI